MSSVNDLSYRPIKKGLQYDKLIPKSTCKSTFLGDGDTYFTLDRLQELSYKYQNQTKRIAKKLQGATMRITIQNVYQFLHDHLQYDQDGFKQQLRSPQCAWHDRANGIDCKSYSLFASTLLLNLGIHHSFRKIRQDYNDPEFSHVYVVIPTDQKTNSLKEYLVIDATVHINKETSPIIEKHDIKMLAKMPHYGLNGTSKRGLNGDAQMTIAIRNFQNFLVELKKGGVNSNTIDSLRNYVKSLTIQNINPKVEFSTKGVYINGRYFSLMPGLNNGITPFSPVGVDTSIFGGISTPNIPVSTGGLKPVTGGLDPTGGIASLALGFLNFDKIIGNFADVFANGFDLSCFNSTYPSSKVTQNISTKHQPIIQGLINDVTSASTAEKAEKALNDLVFVVSNSAQWYNDMQNGNSWSKCSRKGIAVYQNLYNDIFSSVGALASQFAGSFVITETTRTGKTQRLPYHIKDEGYDKRPFKYKVYRLTPKQTISNNNNVGNSGNQLPKPPKEQTAGFGGVGIVAAVILGAFLLKRSEIKNAKK